MTIPAFDHNHVLPPYMGSPTRSDQLSPYPCTTLELVQHFATSPERKKILRGFLEFRKRLRSEGLNDNAFQWLDGSFLEDVETRRGRPPKDLDLVTVYWGYDESFQIQLANQFPEFVDPPLCKTTFQVDHYPLDASHHPNVTVESIRYWALLFSHSRDGVWKGMLRIDLNTDLVDSLAMNHLNEVTT